MSIFDTGKPLVSASDNLHMAILATVARVAGHDLLPGVGDRIDRGLITLRLLNEAGYDVVPRAGAPFVRTVPTADYLPTLEQYVEIMKAKAQGIAP